ncbi:hypothetical protein OKW40_004851 [Paraburkholderia sp. RAU6.4a]
MLNSKFKSWTPMKPSKPASQALTGLGISNEPDTAEVRSK